MNYKNKRRKINKKTTNRLSLFLAATFLIASFSMPVYATETTEEIESTEEEKNLYIPLRLAFEDKSATVSWDNESKNILVTLPNSDDSYEYQTSTNEQLHNDIQTPLSYPLVLSDGVYYIHYDDCAFLFDDKSGLYEATKREMIPYIYQIMARDKVPGLTFSFVDNQLGYQFELGFGLANMETKQRVTNDSKFSVASISKNFTTIGIMQLVDSGKIDLDEKVVTYLPDFKQQPSPLYGGDANNITVRMLLSHRSGMFSDIYDNIYDLETSNPTYMNNFLANIENTYMQSKEDTRTIYANAGFMVLGQIISVVSGENTDYYKGYTDYMNEFVLSPLEMTNSTFTPVFDDSYTQGYKSMDEKGKLLAVNIISAGGLFTTASDMSNYMTMLLNNGVYKGQQIISSESIQAMFALPTTLDPLNAQFIYGLGTSIVDYNNKRFIGHDGALDFAYSAMYMQKNSQLGVFVSENAASGMTAPSEVAIVFLDKAVDESGRVLPPVSPLPPVPMLTVKEDFASYAGYYNAGKIYFEDNGNATIRELDFTMEKISDNLFTFEGLGTVSFATVDGVDCLIWIEANNMILLQGVEIAIPVDVEQYIGVYEIVITDENDYPIIKSTEIATDLDGNLTFTFRTNTTDTVSQATYLKQLDETRFITSGIGRNLGQVIEFVETDTSMSLEFFGGTYVKNK